MDSRDGKYRRITERDTPVRQTQHRPSTDVKTANKLLSDLKRENQALKRKVAKLQKFLQKAVESKGVEAEEPETEVKESLGGPQMVETKATGCPNCGSDDITQIILPTGVLAACRCGWRKKV